MDKVSYIFFFLLRLRPFEVFLFLCFIVYFLFSLLASVFLFRLEPIDISITLQICSRNLETIFINMKPKSMFCTPYNGNSTSITVRLFLPLALICITVNIIFYYWQYKLFQFFYTFPFVLLPVLLYFLQLTTGDRPFFCSYMIYKRLIHSFNMPNTAKKKSWKSTKILLKTLQELSLT